MLSQLEIPHWLQRAVCKWASAVNWSLTSILDNRWYLCACNSDHSLCLPITTSVWKSGLVSFSTPKWVRPRPDRSQKNSIFNINKTEPIENQSHQFSFRCLVKPRPVPTSETYMNLCELVVKVIVVADGKRWLHHKCKYTKESTSWSQKYAGVELASHCWVWLWRWVLMS